MPVRAQTVVHFPSQAPGPSVQLNAFLYLPSGEGKHPAVVFMHGCGGLLASTGQPYSRERQWAQVLNQRGYAVLMVDSFTPRGVHNMCSPSNFEERVYVARPYDAYAALAYLQKQDFVDPERVAIMGWSEGGGTVLLTVGSNAPHKPPGFRAAVAFYPGSCSVARLGNDWRSNVPLLILVGAGDVWTPLYPCTVAMEKAEQSEPRVQLQAYEGAYHDFDWPGEPVHLLKSYAQRNGVIPIAGENPAARADALERVPAFLEQFLAK